MTVFETALAELKSQVKTLDISPKSLMSIGKIAMEIVENTEVKGSAQKDLVIRLVETIIKDCDVNNNIKEACLEVIKNGTLEATIDLVVSASKGELNLNKITPAQAKGIFNVLKKLVTMCLKK